MNPGIMSEKTGSCRPTIAESWSVTVVSSPPTMGATRPPRVMTGMPNEPNATGAVLASRAMAAA
jgi:hypothetical protein